ncbi:MAG: DbpA RNA binding domain-containing protein [Treponemataceae bacterium]|nr:DbpA RNA binding domain-containing protein [Spirochaetales bacterium]MDY6031789.1 DbpA RNA binding domain-containing protein [Treponemataceae bacterium]
MSNKKDLPIDMEQLAAIFKDAVSKVRIDEDPLVLNEYRSVFKKNVPFNLRSYVAAYLAAQMCQKDGSRNYRHGRNNGDFNRNSRKNSTEISSVETESVPRPPRVVIPEESAAQIFIGIGKNRHVKPRDLVGIITQVCHVDRDRIGSIRTMDNYSFVTLYKEDAETVIGTLNGYQFRGKNLNVAHSIPKNRSENDSPATDTSVVTETDNQELEA